MKKQGMTFTGGKECKNDFSTINVYVPIPAYIDLVDVAACTGTGLCIPQCSYIRSLLFDHLVRH
jgi:hypothetical protein